MPLHPYTLSLKINLKWFIKRLLNHKNSVDESIARYLKKIIIRKYGLRRGLNIGCGYYTPNDTIMRRITPRMINVDSTSLVKIVRPFSGMKLILDNDNWKYHLNQLNPQTIYCFHTFSFIQINWLEFIEFCAVKKIKFCFDWSIRPLNELDEGVNAYCVGSDAQTLFRVLLENEFKVMDMEEHLEQTDILVIKEGNRFLVSNFSL